MRIRRSVCEVPGNVRRMLEKARGFPADVLMLDLEDSVPENDQAKQQARNEIADVVHSGTWAAREIGVRLNTPRSPWFQEDVKFAVDQGFGTVILAKVASADELTFIDQTFDYYGAAPDLAFIMSIETPRCLIELAEVVKRSNRVSALIAGGFDFTLETAPMRLAGGDVDLTDKHITFVLQYALSVARTHRLSALRSCLVMNFRDYDRVRALARDARMMGFDGMATYYPGHIDILNEEFAPSAAELAWADETIRILDESNTEGRAALSRDGQVVLPQHGKLARRLKEFSEELAQGVSAK